MISYIKLKKKLAKELNSLSQQKYFSVMMNKGEGIMLKDSKKLLEIALRKYKETNDPSLYRFATMRILKKYAL